MNDALSTTPSAPATQQRAPPTALDTAVFSRVQRLIRVRRLPHALLFVGSQAQEIRECALAAAREINCRCQTQGGQAQNREAAPAPASKGTHANEAYKSEKCDSCRLLAAQNHPDISLIDCTAFDGNAMETLRETLATSYRKPFLGGARVTILERCDELSLAAHNLLLKTLEEPRPENYYILTSPNASLLPSTILSRSQVWFFAADLTALPNLESEISALITEQIRGIARGEIHSAVLLAGRIHKELKEQIPLVLVTLQRIAREQLMASTDLTATRRWATFITDLCELEYAIGTRNFNSQYQFAWALERLARGE